MFAIDLHLSKDEARLLDKLYGKLVLVVFHIDDLGDPRVDNHLGTDTAWLSCAVELPSFDTHSMICSLDDGILFSMESPAQFVVRTGFHPQLLSHTTTKLIAVRKSFWSAIIASRKDLSVLDNHCTYVVPEACTSCAY